jgi:pyruvate/2-oxoglutarate dehydrogenase complex dihydrolipoamide acyltransferase (E2) component
MKSNYSFQNIPQSRIATFDTFSIGLSRHHVSALIEVDVTNARDKLKQLKGKENRISFNAWIIKVISRSLEQHREAAAFFYNKRKLIVFNDINVSILVEKKINDKKVPIPMVIEKTNEKSVLQITKEIEESKIESISGKDIVLNKQSKFYKRLYYLMPGIIRRSVWKIMLSHPKLAYKNMGNIVITSLGMMGRINGWFIHKSVHPLSFGIGSIIKKPVVIDDQIKIREILNMTILFDHDVIDGAPFVRFLKDLIRHIENGDELHSADII